LRASPTGGLCAVVLEEAPGLIERLKDHAAGSQLARSCRCQAQDLPAKADATKVRSDLQKIQAIGIRNGTRWSRWISDEPSVIEPDPEVALPVVKNHEPLGSRGAERSETPVGALIAYGFSEKTPLSTQRPEAHQPRALDTEQS